MQPDEAEWRDMDPDQTAISPLGAIVNSARQFGLTDEEVWRTADETLFEVGTDATVLEYLDELTGALARDVLLRAGGCRSGSGAGGTALKK